MPLPYENSTSGEKALGEINKILRGFGCDKVGSMIDDAEGTILLQFQYRGRQCQIKASMKGYAAAWLREHPVREYKSTPPAEHLKKVRDSEKKAYQVASVAVYSILRDWVKGQLTAVETGIISFEGAFLGNLLLSSGKTVHEHVTQAKMLPAPEAAS